ncbi:hypothetical protein ACBP46_04645 [Paenalcaligenes hominis]|uniref:hypothetical protein n=1 Tax=Paenalcaligenes hominis TaxID=643674 RepID=UPI003525FF89
MRATVLKQSKDSFIFQTFDAFRRTANLAREDAIKTNTGIVIKKNGKIVEISVAELKQEAVFSKKRETK